MAELKFTTNTYQWAGLDIPLSAEGAIQFSKTKHQLALDSINYYSNAQLTPDGLFSMFVPDQPVAPDEGDIWWSGTQGYRYSALFGETPRVNSFTGTPYTVGGTAEVDPDVELEDRACVRYTRSSSSGDWRAGYANVFTAGTYTVSFSVVSTASSGLRSFVMWFGDQSYSFVLSEPTTSARVYLSATVAAGTHEFYLTTGEGEEPMAGDTIFLGAPMVESGLLELPFFDGDSANSDWVGTPGSSNSQYTPGWVDDDARVKAIYDIIADEDVTDGQVDIYSGPQPASPVLGDLWDDDQNNLWRWDGLQWVALVDSGDPAITEYLNNAAEGIQDALDQLVEIEDRLDGVVTIFYQPTEPANPGTGDIWIDISEGKIMKRWDGDSWELIDDERILELLNEVSGKISTYYSDSPPPGTDYAVGDLWIETDQNNKLYRWDGSEWVDVSYSDPRIDESITNYVMEYAVNSSEITPPTTGWSTDTPTRTSGTFIWFRVTVTYGDGTTSTTEPALLTGNTGGQGVQGPPGEDGESLYTWIRYADTPTTGMSDSPVGKTYLGLAFNKTTPVESSNYGDYTWSLIKGEDGNDGVPGPPGADGTPRYIWIKYADTPTTGMSDDPTGKSYMGVAYNQTTPTESTDYGDYEWTLTRGAPGDQGVPGPPGDDGQPTYMWIKYADDDEGNGMTDLPLGKTYIGLAHNKPTPTESNNPSDYTWALFQGPEGQDGIQGPPGEDGQPTYTWIKYGTNSSGADLSDDPTGRPYIGIAYNKLTEVESTNPNDYTWSLFQGPEGSQGVQGPPGEDGQSLYTWLKYADTPTTGMSDSPTGKEYIGLAYNKTTPTESTNYGDYQWALIQGPQGDQGVAGPPGDDGQSLYTWVKYSNVANPTTSGQISDNPDGMAYIGLAYNKTTQTESTNPSDYTWSLIQGAPGAPGDDGVSVISITPYFIQLYMSDAPPSTPTTNPPGGSWVTTEPGWKPYTNLFRTDLVVYSNSTFAYTAVTKVSSYEGIEKTVNLVNNPSISGSTARWSGTNGAVLSVLEDTFGPEDIQVMKVTSSGDSQVISDKFYVDPSKAYEIRIWLKDTVLISGYQLYFGAYLYRPTGVMTYGGRIHSQTGALTDSTNNYFVSWDTNAPIGTYVECVAYLLPYNTPTEDAVGLGKNVTFNLRMSDPRTNEAAIRFLNYNNAGTPRDIYAGHIMVSETSMEAIRLAGASKRAADAAMTTANGKNLVTYSNISRASKPGDAPDPDPARTVGDIHRNRATDNGEIFAEWYWNGFGWITVKFGDEILTSMDVGKLTAGAAEIDGAVINKLNTDIVRIGTDGTNMVDNPQTYSSLPGWSGMTSFAAVGDHPGSGSTVLVIVQSSSFKAVVNARYATDPPGTRYRQSVKIRKTNTGAGAGSAQLVVVAWNAAGTEIGSWVMDSISRSSMASNVWYTLSGEPVMPPGAARMQFQVWFTADWTLGTVQLTDAHLDRLIDLFQLGSSTEIHVRGAGNNLTVYAPGDFYPDGSQGPPKPMTRMGGTTGGAFIAFDPVTGDELGGTNADGTMSTPHLDAGAVSVGGKNIEELVTAAGRGLGTDYLTTSHSGYTTEVSLVGFEMKGLIAGHLYRISISLRGNCSDNAGRAIMSLRGTTNGSAPSAASPDLSSYGTLWPPDWSFANDLTGYTTQRYHEFTFIPTNNINRLRIMLTGRVNGPGTINTRTYVINTRYEGEQKTIGMYNAFVAPPAIPFDEIFEIDSHKTVSQYGDTPSQYKGYYIRHGTGGSSIYRSGLVLSSAARALAPSATQMWLELTFAQDTPYSTPYIGTYTGTFSSATSITNSVQRPGGPTTHGQSKWLELNSTQVAAIASGSNIAVGRTIGLTLVSYYGAASNTVSYRPKIRIKGVQ